MSAGPEEADPVAMGADRVVQHPSITRAVNGDERVDLRSPVPEEVLHSPQVSGPLFADRSDKQHVVARVEPVAIHEFDDGQHGYQPAGVVGDPGSHQLVPVSPDGDVGSFRKHGVEVRHHRDRPASGSALPARDDVPDLIEFGFEPRFAHESQVVGSSHFLREGRRRDLGQLDEQAFVFLIHREDFLERRRNPAVGRDTCQLGLVLGEHLEFLSLNAERRKEQAHGQGGKQLRAGMR